MEAAVRHAQAALKDQRTLQPRFREAQLDILFKTLQEKGDQLIEQLSNAASGIRPRLEAELAFCLTSITQLSQDLPEPSVWWRGQTRLADAAGERLLPAGVVAIQANTQHPILSIFVPLACSIAAGNAAIVTNVSSKGQKYLTDILSRALDQDTYYFLSYPDEQSVEVDARIGLATSASPTRPGQVAFKPAFGPVPVIVDQSCLDGKPIPHPLDNPDYHIPKLLRKVARDFKTILAFESATRQNAAYRASSSPSYALVHENVLALFQRAIKEEGIETNFKTQLLSNAKDVLSALPSPTALQYIPVFAFSSLDRAIDFVNNEAITPTMSYVFASPNFSAYAANQLEGDDVIVGGIPEAIVAQGPYRKLSRMHFHSTKTIMMAAQVSRASRHVAFWKAIAPKKIKRKSDGRIDFFFSGILLSFGLTASTLVGLAGFGAFKAVMMGLRYYKRVN